MPVPPGEPSPRLCLALVHSEYASDSPSGENRLVDQQEQVLREAGHEVHRLGVRTDDLSTSTMYTARTALKVAFDRGLSPLAELRGLQPDLVHVHNLFPNFTRGWVDRWPGPLVATLHNYRVLCPAATLFRDGHVCRDCVEARSAQPALRHACYRGSRLATLPLALSTRFDDDPVVRRADRLIVLHEGMRRELARAGVAPSRLRVLDNFVPDAAPHDGGDYFVYVGRITEEKGIVDVIRDWPVGQRLVVVGEQRDLPDLPAHGSVEYAGRLTQEQVITVVGGACGLVFPSRWIEGLALVCLEALSVGTPVLAWPGNPAAELVAELGIGAVHSGHLADSLADARARFPMLREHCRGVHTARFSPQAWLASVEALYRDTILDESSSSTSS